MHSRSLLYISAFVFIISCETKVVTTSNYLDIDSLINAQVKNLIAVKARVKKNAGLEHVVNQSEHIPDSLGWANELDVFRQLDMINKPSYKDSYEILDRGKDINSNLTVRSYEPRKNLSDKEREKLPVRLLKFYYYQEHLKKMEALFTEKNNLHYTTRIMNLEFDDRQGAGILSHYSIEGVQKMILTDTVRFRITGDVLY